MKFEGRFYGSVRYSFNRSLIDAGLMGKSGRINPEERMLLDAVWKRFEPDLRHDVEELKKEMNVPKHGAYNGRYYGDCGCYKQIVAALAAMGFLFLLILLV